MSDPAVSVIVAAYNCADLIGRAVQSVRAQTYRDFEVVIVDDGSTDRTWQVVQELAAGWPEKVRAFRAEHRGLAAARNRAIAEARGQYLAPLDADDVFLPEKLQRCMDYLAAHPDLSIVYTPMAPVRLSDGKPMSGHCKPCHAGQLTARLFASIFVHDPAAVFHRRVIETCGGFDESLPVCVGHEFWLRVSTRFQFGLIDEPLALRGWRQESLTRSNRARGRCVKAAMLERFYFQGGGRDLLPRRPAWRRLSRVHYSAGKILLKEGAPHRAAEMLAKALRYNRANLKAWPLFLAARLAGLFAPDRDG